MQTLEEVTRKINKLLKLANGATEEEAKSAMDKALQLASENSLDIETAAIMGEESIKPANEPVEEKVNSDGSKLKITDHFVVRILEDHFNVKILYHTWNRQTRIKFIGTNSDIEIASEIYTRLTDIFKYQWIEYRAKTNAAIETKRIYFSGLSIGINETLAKTKTRMIEHCVELLPERIDKDTARNRYQIILSEPQKRNKNFVDTKYGKLHNRFMAACGYNPDVFSDGLNDGRAVDVEGKRKAIMA
jgi:hypothetical protein